MSWIRRKIVNWLRHDLNETEMPPYPSGPRLWAGDGRSAPAGFTVTIVPAVNGFVLTSGVYDVARDRWNSITRVCTEQSDLVAEMTAIVADIKLR